MSHEHLETFTEPGGHHRPLGFTPPSVEIEQNLLMMGCEPVTAGEQLVIPLVPVNDWEEFDVRRNPNYPIQVKDQDGKGACNGHATATAMELARYFNGQPHVALSGWFPYALLCNGVDRGSSIGEALGVVTRRGLSPESDVPYGIIHPQKLTSEAHSSAQHYKCVVGMRIQTWDQLMSAVQLRMGGINLSIKVGMNFNLDAQGVVNCSGGPGNHAICAGHGAKRLPNGTWAILWQNSWSTKWGDGGYAWLTQAHWDQQSYKEAFVIRTPAEHLEDGQLPPVVML